MVMFSASVCSNGGALSPASDLGIPFRHERPEEIVVADDARSARFHFGNILPAARAERYLTSPIDGEVSERFPKTGELVGQGSPVMAIVDLNDMWFTFAVREDMLRGITPGTAWTG